MATTIEITRRSRTIGIEFSNWFVRGGVDHLGNSTQVLEFGNTPDHVGTVKQVQEWIDAFARRNFGGTFWGYRLFVGGKRVTGVQADAWRYGVEGVDPDYLVGAPAEYLGKRWFRLTKNTDGDLLRRIIDELFEQVPGEECDSVMVEVED